MKLSDHIVKTEDFLIASSSRTLVPTWFSWSGNTKLCGWHHLIDTKQSSSVPDPGSENWRQSDTSDNYDSITEPALESKDQQHWLAGDWRNVF